MSREPRTSTGNSGSIGKTSSSQIPWATLIVTLAYRLPYPQVADVSAVREADAIDHPNGQSSAQNGEDILCDDWREDGALGLDPSQCT